MVQEAYRLYYTAGKPELSEDHLDKLPKNEAWLWDPLREELHKLARTALTSIENALSERFGRAGQSARDTSEVRKAVDACLTCERPPLNNVQGCVENLTEKWNGCIRSYKGTKSIQSISISLDHKCHIDPEPCNYKVEFRLRVGFLVGRSYNGVNEVVEEPPAWFACAAWHVISLLDVSDGESDSESESGLSGHDVTRSSSRPSSPATSRAPSPASSRASSPARL
jgi:hypothetical protein